MGRVMGLFYVPDRFFFRWCRGDQRLLIAVGSRTTTRSRVNSWTRPSFWVPPFSIFIISPFGPEILVFQSIPETPLGLILNITSKCSPPSTMPTPKKDDAGNSDRTCALCPSKACPLPVPTPHENPFTVEKSRLGPPNRKFTPLSTQLPSFAAVVRQLPCWCKRRIESSTQKRRATTHLLLQPTERFLKRGGRRVLHPLRFELKITKYRTRKIHAPSLPK